ncbi:TetR/AcrR family transcriptional regulator [Micrococcus porci]|uniref:TetR/AcrR family transcriptional regulator n=1 Tax=Micrococcus porci TaxID=2856555 RepID=UPI003CF0B4D7
MNWNTSTVLPRDGRSARWDRHRQDRRVSLVRAARAAVHELGPTASMDEIAAHAGTSKSVFYRYFGDRAGLRQAVAERVTASMERRLREAAVHAPDGVSALHRMVAECLSVAASSPAVYAFAVTQDGTGPDLDPFFERIAALLAEGLARTLPAADAGPGTTLVLWPRVAVGTVRAAVEAWLATEESVRPDPVRTAHDVAGWLLAGLHSADPSASPAADIHTPTQQGEPS